MSDALGNITQLATLGLIGFMGYLGYSILNNPDTGIGKAAGDLGSAAATAAGAASKAVDLAVDTGEKVEKGIESIFGGSDTVGVNERCVNNADCSATGYAGGVSVGIDALGLQDFGCCSGRCRYKNPDKSGKGVKWCPGEMPTYPGINELSLGGECSATGYPSKELAIKGNNPLNIIDCNGRCQIGLDKDGNRYNREVPKEYLNCPEFGTIQEFGREGYDDRGDKKITYALGHICNSTSDCSATGLGNGDPSDGTCISCITGKCSYNNKEKGSLCNIEQDEKNEKNQGNQIPLIPTTSGSKTPEEVDAEYQMPLVNILPANSQGYGYMEGGLTGYVDGEFRSDKLETEYL